MKILKHNIFSKLGNIIALILNRLPLLFRNKIPAFIWRTLEKSQQNNSGNFIKGVYGVYMKQNWTDATFRFAIMGRYGFTLADLLKNRKKDFIFFDVGANYGLYSLLAAQNKYCKKIYAFEPNEIIFDIFLQNIEANRANHKIKPLKLAISNFTGEQELSFTEGHSGRANLIGMKSEKTMSIKTVDFIFLDKIYNEIYNTDL